MKTLRKHVVRCVLAGMVALLPIGGTVLMLTMLESQLRALIVGLPVYFPGMALLLVVVGFYLLGLVVSSIFGKWILRLLDAIAGRLPILGPLYETLKQIAGYGTGKQAIFQRAVFVTDSGTGVSEIGLVTAELAPRAPEEEGQLVLFVPGSPNPAAGRMVLVPATRCRPCELQVDEVMKALISVGKSL